MTIDQAKFQRALFDAVDRGWTISTRDEQNALLRDTPPSINNALHAVLSILTCGFWLMVWLVLLIFESHQPRTMTITAMEDGSVWYSIEGRTWEAQI